MLTCTTCTSFPNTTWCTPDTVPLHQKYIVVGPGQSIPDNYPVPAVLTQSDAFPGTTWTYAKALAYAKNPGHLEQDAWHCHDSRDADLATTEDNISPGQNNRKCWKSVGDFQDVAFFIEQQIDGLAGGYNIHFKDSVMMYDQIVSMKCIQKKPLPWCITAAIAMKHGVSPPCDASSGQAGTQSVSSGPGQKGKDESSSRGGTKSKLKWILPLACGISGEMICSQVL